MAVCSQNNRTRTQEFQRGLFHILDSSVISLCVGGGGGVGVGGGRWSALETENGDFGPSCTGGCCGHVLT